MPVVFLTEFGRTPQINGNAGRDHFPNCYTILFAGAGVQGGSVLGKSDRIGLRPIEAACTPEAPAGLHRIISSADVVEWEVAAHIPCGRPMNGRANPRFTVTPDNQLIVVAAGSDPVEDTSHRTPTSPQSWLWKSQDGREWNAPKRFASLGFRASDLRRHGDRVFSVCTGAICGNSGRLRIQIWKPGQPWPDEFTQALPGFRAAAGSLVFTSDAAHCLISRYCGTGYIGTSSPTYHEWEWKDSGTRISHANLIRLLDGRVIASVRMYDGHDCTSLCWFDAGTGRLTEALELPGGREPVNVGLFLHNGRLWVSHYAPHRGKMGVYLSQVQL